VPTPLGISSVRCGFDQANRREKVRRLKPIRLLEGNRSPGHRQRCYPWPGEIVQTAGRNPRPLLQLVRGGQDQTSRRLRHRFDVV